MSHRKIHKFPHCEYINAFCHYKFKSQVPNSISFLGMHQNLKLDHSALLCNGTKSGLCFRRKTQVVFHFEQKECRAWKIEHFCVKITRGEVGYYS